MKTLVLAIGALVFGTSLARGDAAAKAAVAKRDRELIVVANLSTHGVENYKWLYRFLEVNAVSLAWEKLGFSYDHIYALTGANATLDGFQDSVATVSAPDAVKAVDVFVHLHGAPKTLWFEEGPRETSELATALAGHLGSNKLRLLYSTSCYGESHAPAFLAAGFQAVNGALAVNTNSMYEYPKIMTMWRRGATIAHAQDKGNNTFWREFYDTIARNKGFPDADSFKVVRGDGSVTIDATKGG